MKIRKELWFGFTLMGIIVLAALYMLVSVERIERGHIGLLMLSLVVVAIMLGFPTAFTLMGMGMIFTFLAYDRNITHTLDLMVQAQVLQLLKRLQRELGLSMLFITHDLSVLVEVADRIAIMYAGRVVEEGPSEELFVEPNHPYTVALLAEIPRLDSRRRQFAPVKGEIPSPLAPPSGCHFHPRCPHAMERCRVEAPALKEIAPGRRSACHLNDAGAA